MRNLIKIDFFVAISYLHSKMAEYQQPHPQRIVPFPQYVVPVQQGVQQGTQFQPNYQSTPNFPPYYRPQHQTYGQNVVVITRCRCGNVADPGHPLCHLCFLMNKRLPNECISCRKCSPEPGKTMCRSCFLMNRKLPTMCVLCQKCSPEQGKTMCRSCFAAKFHVCRRCKCPLELSSKFQYCTSCYQEWRTDGQHLSPPQTPSPQITEEMSGSSSPSPGDMTLTVVDNARHEQQH